MLSRRKSTLYAFMIRHWQATNHQQSVTILIQNALKGLINTSDGNEDKISGKEMTSITKKLKRNKCGTRYNPQWNLHWNKQRDKITVKIHDWNICITEDIPQLPKLGRRGIIIKNCTKGKSKQANFPIRGIILAGNVGKVYETIINERVNSLRPSDAYMRQ